MEYANPLHGESCSSSGIQTSSQSIRSDVTGKSSNRSTRNDQHHEPQLIQKTKLPSKHLSSLPSLTFTVTGKKYKRSSTSHQQHAQNDDCDTSQDPIDAPPPLSASKRKRLNKANMKRQSQSDDAAFDAMIAPFKSDSASIASSTSTSSSKRINISSRHHTTSHRKSQWRETITDLRVNCQHQAQAALEQVNVPEVFTTLASAIVCPDLMIPDTYSTAQRYMIFNVRSVLESVKSNSSSTFVRNLLRGLVDSIHTVTLDVLTPKLRTDIVDFDNLYRSDVPLLIEACYNYNAANRACDPPPDVTVGHYRSVETVTKFTHLNNVLLYLLQLLHQQPLHINPSVNVAMSAASINDDDENDDSPDNDDHPPDTDNDTHEDDSFLGISMNPRTMQIIVLEKWIMATNEV